MRPVTTLILFFTSILLGITIWWSDREAAQEGIATGGNDAGKALLRLEPENLGRIVVKRSKGDTVLELRNGYWFLNSPVADRADPESIQALLDVLSHLTVLDQIPAAELGSRDELKPEALGLDGEKVIRVELTPLSGDGEEKASGPAQVVLIGNPAPLANSTYARIPDSKERQDVYIVDGNPRKYLDDPVTALRDRHLFLAPADQMVGVTVKTPRGDIEMRRKITPPETDWELVRPLETRADRNQIDQLLTGLAGLRVDSVSASGELPQRPPNPVPDGHSVIELQRFGVETPLVIHLQPGRKTDSSDDDKESEKPPLIEARVSDRPAVFQLRSDFLEALPTSTNAFRDPHLAAIPPQTVFGIVIESRGNPPVVLKTARSPQGVQWFSIRNGEELANESQIFEFIQALNEEKVVDYVSDSPEQLAEYNLSQPAVQIAINHYELQPDTAPDGAPAGSGGQMGATKKVLHLGYLEAESDDSNAPASHRLFANWAGEPFIFELNPAFPSKVPTHPLKWKDLKLLSFNPISLRAITRQQGDGAAIELTYDYRRDHWEVVAGDPGRPINRDSVRSLRETLGSLTAVTWMTPSPQAFQALENPDAVLSVILETVDQATGSARKVTHTLRFAKAADAATPLYYGRLDDSPDIFQIDRDTFRDLVQPLFSTNVQVPE